MIDSLKRRTPPSILAVLRQLNEYRNAAVLTATMIFITLTRLQSYQSTQQPYGTVFPGNDPWYHFRSVMFTVQNFPQTMALDPRSGYPTGATTGTFGTIYDQLLATVSLVIGLGSPSEELIRTVVAVSPVVVAAFVVVPTYLLTKFLTGSDLAGLLSAVILALQPGSFLSRSVAGVGDHHIVESLLLISSLYAFVRLIDVAKREVIIEDLLLETDMEALRPWGVRLVPAVIAFGLYTLIWPASVGFFAVVCVGVALHAFASYGRTIVRPELISVLVLSAVLAIVMLLFVDGYGFVFASLSLFQVSVYAVAAVGFGLFILFARLLEKYDYRESRYFIALTGGTSLLGVGVLAVFDTRLFGIFLSNIQRALGISTAAVDTIGEQQAVSVTRLVTTQYGLTLVLFGAGVGVLLLAGVRAYQNQESFAVESVLVVFSVFMLVISLRTARFNYYLAPIVCVMSAHFIHRMLLTIDWPDTVSNVKAYHVLAIVLVASTLVPVLMLPVDSTAVSRADQVTGTQSYEEWHEPLTWMGNNTPPVGIGEYEDVDDSVDDYTYQNDTYGVMSWWDYGHWITVTGNRTPVANPFQQNAKEAADYLLADSAEAADKSVSEISDESANIRYVAVDWQMVSPNRKFLAPVTFNDSLNREQMISQRVEQTRQGARLAFLQPKQRYYESLMVRLWYGHGSRMEPGPYATNYETRTTQGQTFTILEGDEPVKAFNTTQQARDYVEDEGSATLSNIGNNPSQPVSALKHYRLVRVSDKPSKNRAHYQPIQYANNTDRLTLDTGQTSRTIPNYQEFNPTPSAVKIFERVPGATITGQNAPPNSTVILRAQFEEQTLGSRFTYQQKVQTTADGSFQTTVPYATTGYNETTTANTSIEAVGSYTARAEGTTRISQFDVTDSAVLSEESDPVPVSFPSESVVAEQPSP